MTKPDRKNADVIPVHLSPEGRQVVANIRQETGVTKKEAVNRILQWFANQPELVRNAILYGQGDAAAELVRLKVPQLIQSKNPNDPGAILDSVDLEQSTIWLRALTARIEQLHAQRNKEIKELLESLKNPKKSSHG